MAKTVMIGSARIDENGKPTEWEAVDMQSGGGGSGGITWFYAGTGNKWYFGQDDSGERATAEDIAAACDAGVVKFRNFDSTGVGRETTHTLIGYAMSQSTFYFFGTGPASNTSANAVYAHTVSDD